MAQPMLAMEGDDQEPDFKRLKTINECPPALPTISLEDWNNSDQIHKEQEMQIQLNNRLLEKANSENERNAYEITRLLRDGADANTRNSSGQTPLMLAAQAGHVEVCTILITHGANVNVQCPANIKRGINNGNIPILHYAARNGHAQICQLLLAHGANRNAINGFGMPALMECIANDGLNEETYDCMKALLTSGAQPNIQDRSGCTPLMAAASEGLPEICTLLLQYGADPSIRTERGITLLQNAHQGRADWAEMDDVDQEGLAHFDAVIALLSDPEKILQAITRRENNPAVEQGFSKLAKTYRAKNAYQAIQNREWGIK